MLGNEESKIEGLRILVVDDDDLNQRLLEMTLSKGNHRLVFAYDGYDALKTLEKDTFDLVFMDMTIPRVNGFEVCEHIRGGDFPNTRTPMVALTALPSRDKQLQDFLDRGMFDECIHKPFNAQQIEEILRSVTLNKEIRTEPKAFVESDMGENVERRVLAPEKVLPIFNSDLATYKRLLAPFMDGLPARIEEMKIAASSDDWATLSRAGHNLKGLAGNFGAESLSFLAEQLDIKAGKQDKESVQYLIQEIKACALELEAARASLMTKNL